MPVLHAFQPVIRMFMLILCVSVLAFGVAHAQEKSDGTPAHEQLDSIKIEIDQIEAGLSRDDLRDQALSDLRDRVAPLKERTETIINKLQPQIQALDKRLEQLGPQAAAPEEKPAETAPAAPAAEQPAPAEKTPATTQSPTDAPAAVQPSAPAATEAPSSIDEHKELTTARKKLDDMVRRGRAIVVQADQILDTITERRRTLFQNELFAQSPSIISPALWMDVGAAAPRAFNSFRYLMADWGNIVLNRMDVFNSLALFALFAVALALAIPGKKYAQRFGKRFAVQQVPPSRLRRSGNAIWILLVNTTVPTITALLLYHGLSALGFLPTRLKPLAVSIVWAVFFVSFVKGLSRGILAPNRSSWRLASLSDETVNIIRHQPPLIALVFACGIVLERFWETISANLAITITSNGLVAIANAITFATAIYALRAAVSAQSEAAGEGTENNDTSDNSPPFLNAISVVIWGAIAVVLGAALVGYIGFARFLANQIIWLAVLGSFLYVLLAFVDDFFTIGMTSQTRFGRFFHRSVGLKAKSFDLINILLSGFIRVVLVILAVMLALAPWGIHQSDMMGSITGIFREFTVGGITISPASILGAISIFIIGVAITRVVQGWMKSSFFPHTSMDNGLQNSINTGLGYFGFILAGGLTMSAVGLGLDKIAIVAGALSVGIGFGLQSIVNNFVSGLILLASRPIKVGDWIALGVEEGNVRKISVRSTEIELFNKSTLIVPNSELIAQKVVNRTMTAGVGRVLVEIITSQTVDVDTVRDIMLGIAEAHPLVLQDPAPSVSLAITETGLKFSLFCFVPSPRQSANVLSEMNFSLFKEVRSRNIALPGAGPDMNMRVLAAVEQSLKQISAPAAEQTKTEKPVAPKVIPEKTVEAKPVTPKTVKAEPVAPKPERKPAARKPAVPKE